MTIFGGNILGIFSKKSFQKNLLKSIFFKCTIWLMFVLKKCQKNVIFKVFQLHLQVLLFKSSGYKSFYIIFEGPNVNNIISYFGHV